MFECNLYAVHALDRVVRHKRALGDGRKRLFGVPGSVVTGSCLVRTVLGIRRIVTQISQQQHRRAGHIRFHSAQAGVQQKGGLANRHTRFAGQAAIDLCHHTGARLFPNKDGSDRRLMIVQGIKQRTRIATRDTKDHINTGLFQNPDNCLTGRDFVLEKELCHSASLYCVVAVPIPREPYKTQEIFCACAKRLSCFLLLAWKMCG